jgi:hypothetical protein
MHVMGAAALMLAGSPWLSTLMSVMAQPVGVEGVRWKICFVSAGTLNYSQ